MVFIVWDPGWLDTYSYRFETSRVSSAAPQSTRYRADGYREPCQGIPSLGYRTVVDLGLIAQAFVAVAVAVMIATAVT